LHFSNNYSVCAAVTIQKGLSDYKKGLCHNIIIKISKSWNVRNSPRINQR